MKMEIVLFYALRIIINVTNVMVELFLIMLPKLIVLHVQKNLILLKFVKKIIVSGKKNVDIVTQIVKPAFSTSDMIVLSMQIYSQKLKVI